MERRGDMKRLPEYSDDQDSQKITVSRHISIDDIHFEMMRPYLERHSGNFQAALKDMIKTAGKFSSSLNSVGIDRPLFKWLVTEIEGKLIPGNILDELIDPVLIRSIGELKIFINHRLSELGWDIDLVLDYDKEEFPSSVLIEMRGDPEKIKLVARVLSQYLVKNSLIHAPLEIKYVLNFSEYIKVELVGSNKNNSEKSLTTFFGGMDEAIKGVKKRPDFWRSIIERHLLSNYDMITIHRNFFEDLLNDKVPTEATTIENLAKKPIPEIRLVEMLSLIKQVYETSGIVKRVDIDKNTITFYHGYRDEKAIDKIKKGLIALLESSGNFYEAGSIANTIVLKDRPDAGIKINEIIDDLKNSKSRFDQQILIFITFLEGLKDIPDIPLSLTALGKKSGISLMAEYEKENDVRNWDLNTFKNAITLIDSRLHRESEFRYEGNDLVYTIRKCGFVADSSGSYICRTAREAFKGALDRVFRGRAELEVRKLLTDGDKICEVVIRIK